MNKMYREILGIPPAAEDFFGSDNMISLPLNVPYLGMGSSYFACLAFKYMGVKIYPDIAAEYHHYLAAEKSLPLGVILSQSGRSSEAVWSTQLFEKYIAISNEGLSPLAIQPNLHQLLLLKAGEERYSSSKTYINTLLALFKGFNIDAGEALPLLAANMNVYEYKGRQIADKIMDHLQTHRHTGFYILGSGPNIATARQAALILSETTKLAFQGMSMAQYDHGPKETAKGSVVIQILSKGPSYNRAMELNKTLREAGALLLTVEEEELNENLSVLNNIVPFNFLGYYLSRLLNVADTFTVGNKVTEVNINN